MQSDMDILTKNICNNYYRIGIEMEIWIFLVINDFTVKF